MARTPEKPKDAPETQTASAGQPAASPAPAAAPAPAEQWLRPFQKTYAFIEGTVKGALNGLAKFSRMGSMLGLAAGLGYAIFGPVAIGFTPALLVYVAGGWFAGLVGGALLGGTIGAATGGAANVALAERREKYADELADARSSSRRRAANPNHRLERGAWSEDRQEKQVGNVDRFDVYLDRQSQQGSWADKVSDSRSHSNSLGL